MVTYIDILPSDIRGYILKLSDVLNNYDNVVRSIRKNIHYNCTKCGINSSMIIKYQGDKKIREWRSYTYYPQPYKSNYNMRCYVYIGYNNSVDENESQIYEYIMNNTLYTYIKSINHGCHFI